MIGKATILCVLVVLAACSRSRKDADQPSCKPDACLTVFRSITVSFLDANRSPVAVRDFQSLNLRTNKQLKGSGPAPYSSVNPPPYVVASDMNLDELSTDGDDVQVSGTHPATGQTLKATFKISGGCACGVEKRSGPTELVFN